MEFGKVSHSALDTINFKLPKDHSGDALFEFSQKWDTQFFIGCSSWARKEWVGNLFPPKTKQTDFLSAYAHQMNAVELNATHYRIFDQEVIAKWVSSVTDGFLFCPKFVNSVSHYRKLVDCEAHTIRFYEQVRGFGKHLGPLFLQMHQNFSPKQFKTLERYLMNLPYDFPIFLELRHPDWYQSEFIKSELLDLLMAQKVGWLTTDTAGRRDVCHVELTTPSAFIRFVGNGLHPTDYTRIDEWVEIINDWVRKGIDSVYFMIHQEDEVHAPVLSKYLVDQLNKKLHSNIKAPTLLNQENQLGLF